ncbi:Small nuclear RNA activating complex (SNAPc), subunit SNAP43 [Heracleum sosnowskyi]|uniref:Small nuclear RNA activating complex (SNAPc), subunit SNAP43 n=1 Tax=Heracleum sosnowskyi TaxID=360622 RepID=A0AAD8GSM4_9APIA|nr:Small nuclear RNA activating complex (SNAPc), subunit SNAP43 [Heracleum sosnowskyi]
MDFRKFSFIYEPTINIVCFMQSLYSHCIGYVVVNASVSTKLGGLYCLYCLYETQPYKPSFRIYISLGELRRLRKLVVDSKKENVNVAPALVNRMLERNMFLFSAVDLTESSVTEKMKELRAKEDATIRIAQKKLELLTNKAVREQARARLDKGSVRLGDDDNYKLEEDGVDDDFAMELEQELAHNEGDSEDELVMELEQTLSDYEGDSED